MSKKRGLFLLSFFYTKISVIINFANYLPTRNKELIRVFKDVDLIENIGSGVLRILDAYDKNCFKLQDKKIIERVGSNKSGYWKVLG